MLHQTASAPHAALSANAIPPTIVAAPDISSNTASTIIYALLLFFTCSPAFHLVSPISFRKLIIFMQYDKMQMRLLTHY